MFGAGVGEKRGRGEDSLMLLIEFRFLQRGQKNITVRRVTNKVTSKGQ